MTNALSNERLRKLPSPEDLYARDCHKSWQDVISETPVAFTLREEGGDLTFHVLAAIPLGLDDHPSDWGLTGYLCRSGTEKMATIALSHTREIVNGLKVDEDARGKPLGDLVDVANLFDVNELRNR